jgi:hypothetical protein
LAGKGVDPGPQFASALSPLASVVRLVEPVAQVLVDGGKGLVPLSHVGQLLPRQFGVVPQVTDGTVQMGPAQLLFARQIEIRTVAVGHEDTGAIPVQVLSMTAAPAGGEAEHHVGTVRRAHDPGVAAVVGADNLPGSFVVVPYWAAADCCLEALVGGKPGSVLALEDPGNFATAVGL